MKNKKIWLVLLVIVLAFGMTLVGCRQEPEPEQALLTVDSTNGKLTVSSLGSYNGKWIVAIGGNDTYTVYAADSIGTDFTFTGTLISSASATLKVWKATSTNHLSNYNGNDVLVLYLVLCKV